MAHSRWASYGGPTMAHGEHTAFGNATRRNINGPTGHLARLEAFEGHSMRAEWVDDGHNYVPPSRKYYVYSYSTVIAIYDANSDALYLNEYHYSHKTTEHQSAAAAWTGRATHYGDCPVVVCEDEDDTVNAAYRL